MNPLCLRTRVSLAALAALLLFFAPSRGDAQLLSPFYISQGYGAALQLAQDTLASDAYLVYAGTFGNLDISDLIGFPVVLNMYLDTIPRSGLTAARYPGMADAWGYVFYSPSRQQTVNLITISIPLVGMRAQGVPVPLPLPTRLIDTVVIAETRSDSMALQLRRNAEFRAYHSRYPDKQPSFVSLGNVLPAGVSDPGGFEIDGPFWTLSFNGGRDTASMTCFVVARSGETFCREFAASSVSTELAARTGASINVLPNPTADAMRIVLELPQAARGGTASIAMFAPSGERVLDLSERFARSTSNAVSIAAGELPAGVYLCRAEGDGWSAGTVVQVLGR